MKLCLVYPGDLFNRPVGVIIPFNQQLFYLYSYLRRHAPQIEVEILDLQREMTWLQKMDARTFLQEAEALLKRTGFDVVGISCWTSYTYPSSVEIARLCKKINPDCTVIVGGWHPTFLPEDFCYPGSPFDYVVQGEGEQALLDILCGRVPREQPTQVVPGTPQPMGVHDLRWGECKYHRTLEAMIIWLSRGCPFACAFCADRLTNYRFLSPRASVAELKRIVVAYPQVKNILIYDPLFGIRKDWRREFLTLLQEADLPIHFWAETRVDLLEKEDVDLLSGLSFRLDMGLESVVPEMLTIMKKTRDPRRYVERAFELDACMNQKQIPHVFNHIYNHPGETHRTLQQMLGFWQDYFRRVEQTMGGRCYTYVSVGNFALMPGSEVFINWDEYVQKYGCAVADRTWWKQTSCSLQPAAGDVIGSRELAEGESLFRVGESANQLTTLSIDHMRDEAFRPHLLEHDWEYNFLSLRAVQGASYFNDKPLKLHPRAILYPWEDGTTVLYHFANRQSRTLSPAGMQQLQALLSGKTIADLERGQGNEGPLGRDFLTALQRFVVDLLSAEFLVLGHPRPPRRALTGRPQVRLKTSCGEMVIELYPDQAPGAVANFLYLVSHRFYNGLRFELPRPSAWVEVGVLYPFGNAPGYTLPLEETGLPLRRGAVALVGGGNHLHGSRLRLYRGDNSEPADQLSLFGQVVDGWETLDGLLIGDYVVGMEVDGNQPGEAQMMDAADHSLRLG